MKRNIASLFLIPLALFAFSLDEPREGDAIQLPTQPHKQIIDHKSFHKENFSNIENITYTNCTFDKCSFRNAKLKHVNFLSCTLKQCDFTNTWLVFCTFKRTKLPYTRFYLSRFDYVSFLYSKLSHTDFTNAFFNNIRFIKTDLSRAIWKDGKICKDGSMDICIKQPQSKKSLHLRF